MATKSTKPAAKTNAQPKPEVASASVAASEPGLGGLLAPGTDFSEILKNQNSAQYAFWKTADANIPTVKNGTGYSLWKFINDAVNNHWIDAQDPTNFELNLKKTDFWKAYGAQALQAASDKAQSLDANGNVLPNSVYGLELQRREDGIAAQATNMGYKLNPDIIAQLATTTLNDAYDPNVYNSSDYSATLQSRIVAAAQAANIPLTGGAGASSGIGQINQLKAYAASQGVSLPDTFYTDAGNQLADPKSGATYDTFQNNIKGYAAAKYSGFAPRIQQGETVSTIAAPYLQEMQNILGVPADSIDLTSNTGDGGLINKALQGQIDPSTGTGTPMPIWQFDQTLRQDPRWNSTPDAQNTMGSIVESLGKMFGKI
jgi:hypothetical protein